MSKRSSSGFGYKIDYWAAIEEDERSVHRYSESGVVATTWRWAAWAAAHTGWTFNNAYDVAVAVGIESKEKLQEFLDDLQRSGAGCLAPADVLGPAIFDNVDPEFIPDWTDGLPFRPSLAGGTTDALYDIEVRAEDSRKDRLAKAKASLARHRRNQAKFGG